MALDLADAEWRSQPYLHRVRTIALNWVENGAGTPGAAYGVHVLKILLYLVGGFFAITLTTPGVGSISAIGDWWLEPIVFQKAVLWTLLWELIGLGCGSGPLMSRLWPPFGASLNWLRPNTVRLPPWPDKVPLTAGTRRTVFDVGLYALILLSIGWLLFFRAAIGSEAGSPPMLESLHLVPLVALLPIAGLRDKTIMLAARFENYGFYVLMFFFSFESMILGVKLVAVVIWVAVALSKLNLHWSYVVPLMLSNHPLVRSKRFKRKLYRSYPEDIRPSRFGALLAYTGIFFELVPPLVLLLFARGGTLTWILVAMMVLWHLQIISSMPQGAPLEWNVFFMFVAVYLFGGHAGVGFESVTPAIALIIAGMAMMPIVGAFRPDKVSFLAAMRYYAGNWAHSFWCFRKESDAEAKLDQYIVKPAAEVKTQLARFFDDDMAELMLNTVNAFLAAHLHGRALTALLFQALDDPDKYDIRLGEGIAGTVVGWNFGDGHLADEYLLRAVQERCNFAEGELIAIMLESQPAHRLRQDYRIVDAATGELEAGWVSVRDLAETQPWLQDDDPTVPIHVVRRRNVVG